MIKPFVYTPPRDMWTVRTEFANGWLTIYHGPNYDEAVRLCEFWDTRQNTTLTHVPGRMNALATAMDKFDQLERWLQTA